MRKLQLGAANATLSAVVDAAEQGERDEGEPTTIIRHGRPVAVVVSYEEWTKLKSRVSSFADLLLAIPRLNCADLPRRRPARIVSGA